MPGLEGLTSETRANIKPAAYPSLIEVSVKHLVKSRTRAQQSAGVSMYVFLVTKTAQQGDHRLYKEPTVRLHNASQQLEGLMVCLLSLPVTRAHVDFQ
jgi:hypothetical protein